MHALFSTATKPGRHAAAGASADWGAMRARHLPTPPQAHSAPTFCSMRKVALAQPHGLGTDVRYISVLRAQSVVTPLPAHCVFDVLPVQVCKPDAGIASVQLEAAERSLSR